MCTAAPPPPLSPPPPPPSSLTTPPQPPEMHTAAPLPPLPARALLGLGPSPFSTAPPLLPSSPKPVPPCPEDAGKWLMEVYPEVSTKDLGGSYNALLGVWCELERAFGWEKSSAKAAWNAKTVIRPAALDKWDRAGRTRGGIANGVGPSIGSVAVFDAAWWRWWAKIQPGWREKDSGKPDRWLRDTYPDATAANWAVMRHPSPNGALSFVATLYWWGIAVAERGGREDRESWVEAVQDVKWLFKGLLAAEVSSKS
ncbi:hypothetical protein B0H13DRAFT_1668447 [Mycena leptocephala]|nr:hypothetical protein B0H13DRAFT_1668447 [Mycena leptocephala]